MRRIALLLAVVLVNLSSCISLKPFRFSMKKEFEAVELELKSVQFYNKYAIKLERVLKQDEVKNVKGTINFVNGKYYHEIIIKSKTPCVIERVDDENNVIYVRFEEGENRFLPFKLIDNIYKLQIMPDYKSNTAGQVIYENARYDVLLGKDAHLAIKRSDKLIEEKVTRVLKGIKVE